MDVCLNDLDKVVEDGSSLKGTGGQCGSDAFGQAASVFATGSLGDEAVDGHETDGLFGEIVGGFELWRGDEIEVGSAVFPQTLGNTSGIDRGRKSAPCLGEKI